MLEYSPFKWANSKQCNVFVGLRMDNVGWFSLNGQLACQMFNVKYMTSYGGKNVGKNKGFIPHHWEHYLVIISAYVGFHCDPFYIIQLSIEITLDFNSRESIVDELSTYNLVLRCLWKKISIQFWNKLMRLSLISF
jgi:hypothetical protein